MLPEMRSTMGLNLIELPVFAASSKLTDQKLCNSQSVKFLENTRSRIFLSQEVAAQTVSYFLRQIGDFFCKWAWQEALTRSRPSFITLQSISPKNAKFLWKKWPMLKKLCLFLNRPNNFGSEVENCFSFLISLKKEKFVRVKKVSKF